MAATIVCALAAAPAQAASSNERLLSLDVNVNVTVGNLLTPITSLVPGTGPASSLQDAFTRSPTNLVTALACPIANTVADATQTIPGVGEVTNQLSAVLCALNVLGYAYRTTYIPPSGPPQVRYFRAVAAVPAPLDVDGNGLPDFTGMLSPSLTPLGAGLTINRLSFPANAKVSIEAILLNPASPNSYVGFGEDGTTAGTAGSWQGNVGVFGISPTTTDLGLVISSSNNPSSLGVIGEVFSGTNPDAPTKISRGNVNFTPVPSTLTTEVRLSQGRQQAIVTSAQPSKVVGDVDLIQPGDEKNIDLTIDKLPSSVDVTHQTTGDGHENTTYVANAPIGSLTARYHDRAGSAIETAAALDATNVPAGIAVDQFDGQTSVGATTGAFGSVEARFAKGGELPPIGAGSGPYVNFHRETTSKLSGGVRLTNLKSVAFNASGPYTGDIQFSEPLPPLQLSAKDDVSGITATGALTGMPLHTTVTADVPNGVFSYDGHGQGITQIALSAKKATGTFFTRASRLDATIDNLPAANTFNVKQEDGKVGVAATNPVGTITVLASDGSDAPAVNGSYAWYEDTPARYRAFARIANLTGLSFSADPIAGSIDTALPQVLNLHGETNGITADGVIDKLPAHVGFSMSGGTTKVIDYNSNGQQIDKITLDASGIPGLPNGASKFHGEIHKLPSHMALTLPPSGGTITLNSFGQHIERVLAQVYETSPATAGAGRQLLEYDEPDKQITADLHNVGNFSLTPGTSPLFVSYDISHDPLDAKVTLNGGTYINGTISNPQPASLTVTPSDGVFKTGYHVNPTGPNYQFPGKIDQIFVETNAAGYIGATLDNLPANLDICAQTHEGSECKPTWVPEAGTQVPADDETYTMNPALVAIQLLPKDINGGVPTDRLTVNGQICPSDSDKAACVNGTGDSDRIVIENLKFNEIEVAGGFKEDDCGFADLCGRAWAAFGTNSDHINGRVVYYESGDDDRMIEFNSPENTFLAAFQKFFFLHYHLQSTDPIKTGSSGSITCGDPKPNLIYDTFLNFDFLNGDNIPFFGGICP
ncbi:MAG TPA: hypothetical protein VFZ89_05475 [Solirubrobacteraceae bacterium]